MWIIICTTQLRPSLQKKNAPFTVSSAKMKKRPALQTQIYGVTSVGSTELQPFDLQDPTLPSQHQTPLDTPKVLHPGFSDWLEQQCKYNVFKRDAALLHVLQTASVTDDVWSALLNKRWWYRRLITPGLIFLHVFTPIHQQPANTSPTTNAPLCFYVIFYTKTSSSWWRAPKTNWGYSPQPQT